MFQSLKIGSYGELNTMLRGIFVIIFFMFAPDSFADITIYTIEGQIQAAFPMQPKFMGEAGQGNQRHRSYQSMDPNSILIYSMTWQIGKTQFKKGDVSSALRYYADGDAISVRGRVSSFNYVDMHGNKGAEYVIRYISEGFEIFKYNATFYKSGQFYSWSVQEIVGMSRTSAKESFRSYVEYFSLE